MKRDELISFEQRSLEIICLTCSREDVSLISSPGTQITLQPALNGP